MPSAVVSYRRTHQLGDAFRELVVDVLASSRARRVADVGAGANPLLPLDVIDAMGLDYWIVDIDPSELAKAPPGYRTVVADIGAPPLELAGFDLVVSRMLAEHVRDARSFHAGVARLLRDGGVAAHLFPTLPAIPFVVNRLLPERIADWVLRVLRPRNRERHAKFPAYYRWCVGPTARQFRRLQSVGFAVERYVGCVGHGYYRRVPVVRSVHSALTTAMLRLPRPWFTSYALVVLRKARPGQAV